MARILFIEEEDFGMEGLISELRDNKHEVIVVGDGETAIKSLRNGKHDFQLIILDVMLPIGEPTESPPAVSEEIKTDEMGLEILRQMRQEMNDQTPVIVLTAAIDIDLRTRINEFGVEKYFSKPTSLEDFIEAVNNVLSPEISG